MKSLVAVVGAGASAYSFSFATDLLVGGLLGVYPSTVFLPVVTWSAIATITGVAALRLAPRGRFLVIPFVGLSLLAFLGGVVGHRHSLIVGGVMFAQAIGVWLATAHRQRSGSSNRRMTWNPRAHSDEDNLRWCWLRAVEWGRWPIFLSQPVAPVLLLWLPWTAVVAGTVIFNILWAIFVRYQLVNVRAAFLGAAIVPLKWLAWPAATVYLFVQGRRPECCVAAFWPLLIFVLGALPTTAIGRIQVSFMRALDYEPTDINPLSQRA